ncbi:MAG: T9SS type A sorting domain-containing protein [Candidatus Cloacimonetes bacterium]|nr:T9SS type A sorting domain-containing protein [Candidatus Cloacimonadota bacterium]
MKTKIQIFIMLIFLFSLPLAAQWSNDPESNTAICDLNGSQALPKIAVTSTGDVYIGWFSNQSGNYDVRLQRLDQQGNELWDHNGIIISDHPSMSWLTDWDMTVDHEDHAILAFQDIRDAGNNDIQVYRISPEGESVWGEDGLQISQGAAFDVSPKVCVTSDNNCVFAWQADEVIIIQKISPTGVLLWGDNGIELSCDDTYNWPQPIAVEADQIILKFFHDSGPIWAPTRHMLAQKFTQDGTPVWAEDVVITDAGGISAWTQVMSICGDGTGGFFIAWNDDRDQNMDDSSFVQYISADGEILFSPNGIEVATMSSRERFYPKLAYHQSSEELYVFWNEMDSSQNQRGISGQKFNLNGERLWSDNGKIIIALSPTDVLISGTGISDAGAMVIFEEAHDAISTVMKGMLLDENGNFVWTQQMVTISEVLSEKLHPVVSEYNNLQWIAVWEDRRNDDGDIYAQNITEYGELGIGLVPPQSVQIDPENALLSWTEPDPSVLEYNIYLDEILLTQTTELSYIYTGLINGQTYLAGVSAVYPEGESPVVNLEFVYTGTAIDNQLLSLPIIVNNFPNPFSASGSGRNSGTNIFFEIPEYQGRVEIAIYNIRGEMVDNYIVENQTAGNLLNWPGRKGSRFPDGIYLYQIKAGKSEQTGKMIMLK